MITPWGGKHEKYLELCKESVAESGVEHLVVRCGPDWELRMYELRNEADYIAWVDADDIVYPGAILSSFALAEKEEVGLVYTDEVMIDKDGKEFCRIEGDCKLFDIVMRPTVAHHLSITKKNSITPRVLDIFEKTKCPLDWAMRVDAAINAGYKRCPMLGYGYRWHGDQIISNKDFHMHFGNNFRETTKAFRDWAWPNGIIKVNQ